MFLRPSLKKLTRLQSPIKLKRKKNDAFTSLRKLFATTTTTTTTTAATATTTMSPMKKTLIKVSKKPTPLQSSLFKRNFFDEQSTMKRLQFDIK